MKRRVREHRIELAVEGQVLTGHHPGVETARPRRGDHVGGSVDCHDGGARRDDFFGQHSVAASEIEDTLAWRCGQRLKYRRAESGDKMSRFGVTLRRPVLPRDFRHLYTSARWAWRASACRRISDRVVRVVIISGSILSSMIAGPLRAAASSKAGANSSVLVMLAPKTPYARARPRKSGFFSAVPMTRPGKRRS